MLSQLFFRRGEAQMGREKGGGENGTPLEHLAPSTPCRAMSKPSCWRSALASSPPTSRTAS